MNLLEADDTTDEPRGNEARIWGPPGTGKTTYLGRQIGLAAQKFGPDRVMVTSFTRAAAAELISLDLRIPKEAIGTLHKFCYRALDRPQIAETHVATSERHIPTWNKEHPGYRLSPIDATVDEATTERLYTGVGDELYAEQEVLRAKLVCFEQWPRRVQTFYQLWEEWKRKNRLMDFTDLLESAARDLSVAPGAPAVIFVDEAQDLSPLQLALLRQWGRHTNYLVIAGDDDQTIYTFAGAAPEVLLDHVIPERFRKVLSQSYRIPRAVHKLSQKWIERVAVREPKEYLPRDADGEIRLFRSGNYKHPEPVVDDAERYVANGKSVMLLTTCSYMLEPLKAVLRKRGLPFHNPYRRKRGDWNPLYPSRSVSSSAESRSLTATERLLAYLRPHPSIVEQPPRADGALIWELENLCAWTVWLKGEGVLAAGALARIQDLTADSEGMCDGIRELFIDDAFDRLEAAFRQDDLGSALGWWMENLKRPRRNIARYPVRVAERGGVAALNDPPKIIIGTGHSVKGAEADVVYLFPDLSPSGTRNWEGKRADRDAVVRLGYVMMTRARESLVICEPSGAEFMPIAAVASGIARSTRAGG